MKQNYKKTFYFYIAVFWGEAFFWTEETRSNRRSERASNKGNLHETFEISVARTVWGLKVNFFFEGWLSALCFEI